MIRVPIPVDTGAVAAGASDVFARATPMRVDRLLELAVLEAIGSRAPQDKRERSIRTMLAGFHAGRYILDVNGRIFDDLESVVVCSGTATLRFFLTPQYAR